MSTEQPGCRILQDLNHGTHFRQIPAYAHKEIAQMHREIVWRFSELKQILARQREALKALIERMKSSHTLPEDCLAIVEYPYFALWIHVSAIQQLKRALHIYKHKRMKWIYQIALDSFLKSSSALSHQSIMTTELDSRLSRSEKDFLCRLHQLICRYGNAMGAVLSAQTEKNFSQAARVSFILWSMLHSSSF